MEKKDIIQCVLFIISVGVQFITTMVLYEVKFKMFTVIKFFFLPMAGLLALSLYVFALWISKYLFINWSS